jgi:hypothetical protein
MLLRPRCVGIVSRNLPEQPSLQKQPGGRTGQIRRQLDASSSEGSSPQATAAEHPGGGAQGVGDAAPGDPHGYLADETHRRRIGRQLNKGENVHALKGVPVAPKKFPTDIPLTCDNEGFADSR